MLKNLIRDEHGQDLIEYGLLGSFVAISAIATLHLVGGPINAMFRHVLAELT